MIRRRRNRSSRIARAVAALGLVGAPIAGFAGAGSAEAQVLPSTARGWTVPAFPDTIVEPRNDLEAAALRFARDWAAGGGGASGAVLAPRGIRLQLEGGAHTGLSARQATASFRDFLRDYEEGNAVLIRASKVSGSPDRGSAVIEWSARVSGTSQRVDRTLFLGLVRQNDTWRVDEIRLLR